MAKRAPRRTRMAEESPAIAVRAAAPVRRPGGLDEVIGQERALGVVRAAISAGRVHHAWIFHGPVGVGKFTAAHAFGADLLDPGARPGGKGGSGEARRLLDAGTHPDLHVITKELAAVSREEQVRRGVQKTIAKGVLEEFLIEPAARTRIMPGDSPAAKVFIVDEAELLDHHGQNALLKTLEEPPEGTVIILVTSAEERLLPTIRSRCQRVAFTPLDGPAMDQWAKRSGVLEGLDPRERSFVLQFADGSPGAATLAVERGIVSWARELEPLLAEADRGRYSPGLGVAMASLVEAWAKAQAEEHEHASKDAANKAGAAWMLRLLGSRYRRQLAERPEEASRAIELVAEAQRQAEASVQVPFVMENFAAQLAQRG